MKKHSGFSVSTVIVLLILFGTLAGGTEELFGIESEPQEQEGSVFSYNPEGKPDPFRPFIDAETAAKKKVVRKPPVVVRSPLQRSAVNGYKLRGIAGNASDRTAIVEDAGGKYYPLFRGTIIGRNNGLVTAILPDRVIVEEMARDRGGQSKVNRITMKLHEE
jgi:Tfp pilus assembly protein PilP